MVCEKCRAVMVWEHGRVGMVVMVVTWVCVSVGMCEGWNGMGEYKGGKKVVG